MVDRAASAAHAANREWMSKNMERIFQMLSAIGIEIIRPSERVNVMHSVNSYCRLTMVWPVHRYWKKPGTTWKKLAGILSNKIRNPPE